MIPRPAFAVSASQEYPILQSYLDELLVGYMSDGNPDFAMCVSMLCYLSICARIYICARMQEVYAHHQGLE